MMAYPWRSSPARASRMWNVAGGRGRRSSTESGSFRMPHYSHYGYIVNVYSVGMACSRPRPTARETGGLGSLCRPIGRNHDAGARRLHIAELECGEWTAVRKQSTPGTQDHRVDQQRELPEQVPSHQGLHQQCTAEYDGV